ncbi:MAG: folylpolyglutamate synthase/dihydrofolate synthase family protein [Phycisphaerae bacterium]
MPIRSAPTTTAGAIKTFRQAVAFLESLPNLENSSRPRDVANAFKLSRMVRLMGELGNPQKTLRVAHIAGTKGKGSTAAMLAGMLRENDLRVGLYLSPHILDIRERISVNGRMISEPEFTRLTTRVAGVIRRLKNERPTYFEALTAIGFLYFAQRAVDLAVLEVGLGGRLDATNIIKPDVCGITSISLDHMHVLGKTLIAITEEKAGIFKPGVPVISAPQDAEVKKTLRRVAAKVGCPLLVAGEDFEFSIRFESSRTTGPQTRICVTTPNSHFEHLHVPMVGDHQAKNCAVALGMLDQLRARGFKIDEEKATAGLARVSLPGRMEIIHHEPRVLVDGAHNAESISAVMHAIGQNITADSTIVIFGCNADKDVDGMLTLLSQGADKVIFTRSVHPKAVAPAELAARFKELTGRQEQFAERLDGALLIANKAVSRDDLVCITGSFYLVADAKRHFAKQAAAAAKALPVKPADVLA